MKKETLYARLVKKKEMILSRCIEHGLVKLVELLVQHDIDLETKACGPFIKPLYVYKLSLASSITRMS